MKRIILLNILVFSLVACNSSSKTSETKDASLQQDSIVAVDSHTSQTSLDYYGVYEGVLPCADCEGIKTKLTLNKDETFVLETSYLKNGQNLSPQKYSGKFSWNEAGNTIKVEGVEDFNNQFFVGEGKLFVLDMSGEKITSSLKDHYVLEQTEVY